MNWIIPANTRVYNPAEAFKKNGFIDWRETAKFENGDSVYIYCTLPIKKILYKTRVIITHMKFSETTKDIEFWNKKEAIDKAKIILYMRLELIEKTDSDLLSLESLLKNGLKAAPQTPLKIKNDVLLKYIEETFQIVKAI